MRSGSRWMAFRRQRNRAVDDPPRGSGSCPWLKLLKALSAVRHALLWKMVSGISSVAAAFSHESLSKCIRSVLSKLMA